MPEVNNEIAGRLALITGASGGIGAACARALWAQGVSLALTYRNNESSVAALVAELQQQQKQLQEQQDESRAVTATLSTHGVDMQDAAGIERLFNEIRDAHGREGPDILISNAGYGRRIPNIADVPLNEFDYTLSVNLRASFVLCRAAVPAMAARRWGRVIFVSSIAAHGGGINGCHYAASKAGLSGLMRSLARTYAADGVTFNDVAPAMIGETGMIPDEKFLVGTPGDVQNIPVGRLGTPAEVANVALMFCQTGYLTGQSVLLSGGLK